MTDNTFQLCSFEEVFILILQTLLPYVLGHTPAGASTRTVLHYAQLVNSGKFCKYDFGRQENMKRYGTPTPPEYDLSKVKTPVTLMWGENDWLADPRVSKNSVSNPTYD